ncbi:CLUMA_CG009107, isoform A [Clunio marinus]|uniref:CLUMA_CG009107, isoform A n=1 Tax=Clunio marinus TaxID=568069 RepID=A0A1J1IB31_9DIPT|nr:CLUMA_CG009107, isoform A [Clunio marinus]
MGISFVMKFLSLLLMSLTIESTLNMKNAQSSLQQLRWLSFLKVRRRFSIAECEVLLTGHRIKTVQNKEAIKL